MLSFDIVFYFFLAYYLDNVLPSKTLINSTIVINHYYSFGSGEYGAKRAPYFFLLPSFWRKSQKKTNLDGQINNGYGGYEDKAANVIEKLQ